MTIRDERLIKRIEKLAGEVVSKIERGEFTEEDEKRLRRYLTMLNKRIEELEYIKKIRSRR